MRPFYATTSLALLLGSWALLMRSQPLAADPRRVADPQALSWHSALVRLEIPVIRPVGGRLRHFTEHCSATTITPGPKHIATQCLALLRRLRRHTGAHSIVRATLARDAVATPPHCQRRLDVCGLGDSRSANQHLRRRLDSALTRSCSTRRSRHRSGFRPHK